jgi:putative transcription factor
MGACELCGKDERTVVAIIEGVELNVCQNCATFGKIIKKPILLKTKESISKAKQPVAQRELIEVVKEDFSDQIRAKREKLGLKQKEFAKFLSEKESLIHKIESGSFIPSLELARKIEKQLGIVLVEQKEITPQHLTEKKETFTIGDILKVK